MDSDISCSDSPTCFIGFLRRKYMKKNNHIYNVETGKIIHPAKSAPTDTKTYVKYEKYRPSIQEEMNLSTSPDHNGKPNRHCKLRSNLTKQTRRAEDAPEFINELEENSRKIENIFPKCKPSVAEKDYENITAAVRMMFADADELKPLPQKIHTTKGPELTKPKLQSGDPSYEHIKLALRMMFSNVDLQIKETICKPESATKVDADKSLRRGSEVKLHALVEDVLKSKSIKSLEGVTVPKSEPTQSENRKQNATWGGILRESSVDTSSDEDELDSTVRKPQLQFDQKTADTDESNLDAEIERLEAQYNQTRRKRLRKYTRHDSDTSGSNSSESNLDEFCTRSNEEMTESVELLHYEVSYELIKETFAEPQVDESRVIEPEYRELMKLNGRPGTKILL